MALLGLRSAEETRYNAAECKGRPLGAPCALGVIMPRKNLPATLRFSLTPNGGDEMVIAALPAVLGAGHADDETGPMWDARIDTVQGKLIVSALRGGAVRVNGRHADGPIAIQNGDRLEIGERSYAVGLTTRCTPSGYRQSTTSRYGAPLGTPVDATD